MAFHTVYGLTETSSPATIFPTDAAVSPYIGSSGIPIPGTCFKIVGDDNRELPVGAIGEVAIKGTVVLTEYYRQHIPALSDDGWLYTGDIACVRPDGYLTIVDRKKELIKHNGYSIYPRELEDILYEHPAVKQCAVVGKTDAKAGENPVAYVVLREGAAATAGEIKSFVNHKVASYKAVHEVFFLRELPISGAGKVLKRVLNE
jgi:acyl-CoA synthetase (AMP-forming)/AMP-acid ligase II